MATGKLAHASENKLAAKIRKAVGAGPTEEVIVTTPTFDRTPGMPDAGAPPEDLEALRLLDKNALKEMGCAPWDEPDSAGYVLMLFPAEWYSKIPDGTRLESIAGEAEEFRRGVTSDDRRFGMLAFGFRVPAKPSAKNQLGALGRKDRTL